jgi:very-short-patch-repair endonuclease
MAACLALGPSAAVARRSAAAYWGFAPPRHEPAEVEMLVVGATRRRPGLRIQRTDRVQSDEIVAPVGFPITSPGRTLLDLAHSEPAIRLGRWLAAAVAKGTVSRAAIGRLLDRYSGCRGTTRLREVLESEPEFTRSEAERVFLGLVSAAQLPPPEVNVRLGSFEVDFYWPEHRVVVEIDGYRFHGSRSSFEQDRARDAALVARGLRVMRATWRQLTRERDVVLVRLAQTLGPG